MTYIVQRNLIDEPLFSDGRLTLQTLGIELTERCNNSCHHCYINLSKSDRRAMARELSTSEWKNILSQAADLGALLVVFTGGEPLLRKDFIDIYLFARRHGLKVKLFTNARLITPELAELFVRIPPLEKIEITVYGMSPNTYDAAACAPGGYSEFRRGVDLLLTNKVPFLVKSALLPQNVIEYDQFNAWARTLPWMDKPASTTMYFYQRGRRDNMALNQRIQRARVDPAVGVKLEDGRQDYRTKLIEFCQRFTYPMGEQLFNCGAGTDGTVDAYGFYQPCLMLRDPKLTIDLNKSSLREALEFSRPNLLKLKAANPDYLERCAHCFLRGLCESCPAASYAEHGCLDKPVEYFCQVTHAQARLIGLLSEVENGWEVQNWKERLENLNTKESL